MDYRLPTPLYPPLTTCSLYAASHLIFGANLLLPLLNPERLLIAIFTVMAIRLLDDTEMYTSSDYGYSPMKTNTNVQIFARDPMLPSVTLQDTVDTDMAYTDSFRGGSLYPFQDSSTSNGYSSSFSTLSDASTDSVQYGHPSDSLPIQEVYLQDYPYDSTGSFSGGDGMSRNSAGSYPSSFTPDPYRDRDHQHQQHQQQHQHQQQQQHSSSLYGQPSNSHSSMGPGPYPDTGYTGYSNYGYEDQTQPQPLPLLLKRKIFVKGKTWMEKKNLVQSMSAFGHLDGTIYSYFYKSYTVSWYLIELIY